MSDILRTVAVGDHLYHLQHGKMVITNVHHDIATQRIMILAETSLGKKARYTSASIDDMQRIDAVRSICSPTGHVKYENTTAAPRDVDRIREAEEMRKAIHIAHRLLNNSPSEDELVQAALIVLEKFV